MASSINLSSQEIRQKLPPIYKQEFSLKTRIVGVAAAIFVVVALVAFALFCSNHLMSLPHDLVHACTHINPSVLGLSGIATVLLVGGVAVVIRIARTEKDELVESAIKDPIIEEAIFSAIPKQPPKVEEEQKGERASKWFQAYIDTSTLNSKTSGKAYLYAVKDPLNHYVVSTVVTLVTPFVIIGSIAYHILRMCIVPFWVGGCLFAEACGGEKRFDKIDLIKEPAESLFHVIKAPFYGIAFMAAGTYSLIDPMGGRVLGAKIERDWNNGASRAEGFWSVGGPQSLWKESLSKLNVNYFLAGCWQPVGVVEYENGKIISAKSLSEALNNESGYKYVVKVKQVEKNTF